MNIPVFTQRLKKFAIAVLLLSIAQWSHDGFVICFGADGHIEIEMPGAKGCCKKSAAAVAESGITQFDVKHCVDIPLDLQKRIASTGFSRLVHSCMLPVCAVAEQPASVRCSAGMSLRRDLLPPHPLQVSLKTVVLLI